MREQEVMTDVGIMCCIFKAKAKGVVILSIAKDIELVIPGFAEQDTSPVSPLG